ncbi:hypothetical protein GC174_11230 [bacterium]|nr:hypothetical protein [bacterium]
MKPYLKAVPALVAIFLLVGASPAALCQQEYIEGPPIITTPPPPPPPPVVPPPVVDTTPPPGPPIIPLPTPSTDFTPVIVVPTDVQPGLNSFQDKSFSTNFNLNYLSSPKALRGVHLIPDSSFPEEDELQGPVSGIIIRHTKGTRYQKVGPYVVKMIKGEILISVKKPSQTALVITPFGNIAINSDGDAIIKLENGTLRVMNLDGRGTTLKVKLDKGPFANSTGRNRRAFTIKPGYELIASKNRLNRNLLRPKDGIARRHFKILHNAHLAISEFSLESALNASDVVADLRQSLNGTRERRILGDMAKMAAVLNHMNGVQGFSVER